MTQEQLGVQLAEVAEAAGVPGVAVGVRHGEHEHYAFHGVTSVEQPLPVHERTLFQIASTGKTYTATAIMCLVAQGRVDLQERVRTYVPELRLQDERVAEQVTVAHLLNHTAGWDGGDDVVDTGEGDDALARFIETLADHPQLSPLGATASYNNAAFAIAGRVVEKVTGQTYERALNELLLEPLGLKHTFLFPADVMTHRFAASHQPDDDGSPSLFRPWAWPRSTAPFGGRTASSVVDQLAWARFHLGDGAPLMPKALLTQMQRPSAEAELLPGVSIGIAWWLRDIDGVRIVEHPGEGDGQGSALTMVPDRDFAISVLVNCMPNGQEVKNRLVRWALEAYLGVVWRDPEPLDLSDEELSRYAGTYTTDSMRMDVAVRGNHRLGITAEFKPADDEPADSAFFPIGMIDAERFIVVDGPFKGLQGQFMRDGDEIVSLMHGGRVAARA